MIEGSTSKNNVINLRRKLELNRSWGFSFQKHNQASNVKVKVTSCKCIKSVFATWNWNLAFGKTIWKKVKDDWKF